MSALVLQRRSRTHSDWLDRSPLKSVSARYVQHLMDHGYGPRTIDGYRESIAHFVCWISKQHVELSRINEALVSRFVNRHLPACRCAPECQRVTYAVRAALARLLDLLRSDGSIAQGRSTVPLAIAAELGDFEHHLKEVRGLANCSRQTYLRHVRGFLLGQFKTTHITVREVKRGDVLRFLKHYTDGWRPQSKVAVCNALRSYFRFKALHGEPTADLIAAFPKIANWRLARLPKTLGVTEIKQLLGAFDRDSVVGRRDYAIAHCLVDL